MNPLIIERKVRGGKLFRIKVTRSGGTSSVQVTGDFFLEPEEGIRTVEARLVDCLGLSDKLEAGRMLSAAISNAGLRIAGFGPGDLIDALWEVKD